MSNNLTNNLQQIANNLGLGFARVNDTEFSLENMNGYTIEVVKLPGGLVDKYKISMTEFMPIDDCAQIIAHQNNLEHVINWLIEYSDMYNENIAIPETIS